MFNLPKGMTEQQLIETINRVSESLCKQFKFTYYDVDDLKQECFIFAASCLDKYDHSKPFDNFLYIHIRNRLINLKRDKYCRTITVDSPRKLVQMPIDISKINDEEESSLSIEDTTVEEVITNEQIEKINTELEAEYRLDFLKMLAGVKVKTDRKEEIRKRIIEILYAETKE